MSRRLHHEALCIWPRPILPASPYLEQRSRQQSSPRRLVCYPSDNPELHRRVLHRRCCSDGAKPASSLPQAHDSWRYPDEGEVRSRDGRGDTLARPSDLPPAEQTEQISGLDISGDSASAKLVAAHWGGLHDALETRWTVEVFVGCAADRQLGGFLVSGGGGAFTAPAIRWPHVPAPGVRYSSQP